MLALNLLNSRLDSFCLSLPIRNAYINYNTFSVYDGPDICNHQSDSNTSTSKFKSLKHSRDYRYPVRKYSYSIKKHQEFKVDKTKLYSAISGKFLFKKFINLLKSLRSNNRLKGAEKLLFRNKIIKTKLFESKYSIKRKTLDKAFTKSISNNQLKDAEKSEHILIKNHQEEDYFSKIYCKLNNINNLIERSYKETNISQSLARCKKKLPAKQIIKVEKQFNYITNLINPTKVGKKYENNIFSSANYQSEFKKTQKIQASPEEISEENSSSNSSN
jgi:hypothetical protein